MTDLEELRPVKGSKKRKKRVGRGPGSGHGKTSCRGHKGLRSRSGGKSGSLGFEGGQMPLQRRLPKRGFRSPFRKVYEIVSLKKISCWEGDSALDPEGMLGCGMICRLGAGVKVLADGSLTRPVHIKAHRFSQEARRKIESVGGVAETI